MDISKPELPYNCGTNPLWNFAFYSNETALRSLKLLLDSGLDADLAGECWSHELTDLDFADFTVDEDFSCELAVQSFKKVMLIASYPHIINFDKCLREELWFDKNNYDISKFREWNKFEYMFEPTESNNLNKAIVKIMEKETETEIWRFGFGLSPNEVF